MSFSNSFNYSSIELRPRVAVPGQAATPSQSVYTPVTYVAGAASSWDSANHPVPFEGVKAGAFVWPSQEAGKAGVAVQCAPSSGSVLKPLGIVERVMDVPNYAPDSQATDVVPEGQAVTIAVRGDYYVSVASAANAGDAAYVYTGDGSVKGVDTTDSAATSAAESAGYQQTSWRFVQDVEAGGIALISNWANQ